MACNTHSHISYIHNHIFNKDWSFHLFLTNFSLTELGMVKSTSSTFDTSISITLSLFALKSFSIWAIYDAVSFYRLISNSLSYFLICYHLLFISMREIRLLFVVGICSLLALLPILLTLTFVVFINIPLPFFLSAAYYLIGSLLGFEKFVNIGCFAHGYDISIFYSTPW